MLPAPRPLGTAAAIGQLGGFVWKLEAAMGQKAKAGEQKGEPPGRGWPGVQVCH